MLSGVASMEQMEQLLPRNAKGHFCNSPRSDEIFAAAGQGVDLIGLAGELTASCKMRELILPSAYKAALLIVKSSASDLVHRRLYLQTRNADQGCLPLVAPELFISPPQTEF
jgi:hypothetical protein